MFLRYRPFSESPAVHSTPWSVYQRRAVNLETWEFIGTVTNFEEKHHNQTTVIHVRSMINNCRQHFQ